ncbi:MAG: SsrA-binding protein SmpB [Puniceicoccales bacterium]|jgi:SsrA-binding protein|nr:SsrA-binding protein SmpB [Puniceicoccales bacterium]
MVEILNRKASHRYLIGNTFVAGIVLQGTEVKSIRAGKAQIADAFVTIDRLGNAHLLNAHIESYAFGHSQNHLPDRSRRLLLHRGEIQKLREAIEQEGQSVIPLKLYFERSWAKLLVAVCRGKKLHDSRESLKEKTVQRETERFLKRRISGGRNG